MFFGDKGIKKITHILNLVAIGVLIGVIGALLGTAFHISVDFVTLLRENNPFVILFLPLGGLVIAAMYNRFSFKGNIDTKRLFQSIKENRDVPLVMIPLIFLGTVITHMLGGSSGREGAALQLGGSMGYNVGKALKQDQERTKLLVTAGMSSVFSALFGTPFTAAVFSLEVTGIGVFNYCGLTLGVVSSVAAFAISQFLRVEPVRFDLMSDLNYRADTVLKVVLLALLCALVCIIFATAIRKAEFLMKRYIPNSYLRAVIGGLLIVFLTVILGTTDYNGAGMEVIKHAISGDARQIAFIIKIAFTAITVAAGFKGGEIVPTFFIGSTFGCVASGLMGFNAGFGAALGLASMFSGMTKCPIAALLLAIEVFGARGIPFFAIAVIIAYVFSGHFGLYDNSNQHTKIWLRNKSN